MNRLNVTAALLLTSTSAALAAEPATHFTTSPAALAALQELRVPEAAAEQQVAALKRQPLRFSVPVALAATIANGRWDRPSAGMSRWRLRIESSKAQSLALQLEQVRLPAGATLWFYDSTGRDVQGPFDAQSLSDRNGMLPLVRGRSAVLEVQAPARVQDQVALQVVTAFHGYRSIDGMARNGLKAAIGSDSESCTIDAVCAEGDSWRDEIRSVVLLTVDGQSLCSGTLVNNARQDDRPLILTANHCGVTNANLANTTAYFNTQSTRCQGNDDGRVDQNIAGSSLLASDFDADFALYTLARKPPAEFKVFYAGWDARRGVVPMSGVGIHHPTGDEKKLSFFSRPAVAEDGVQIGDERSSFFIQAWRVHWTRGVAAPGSSGSALFNQDKQIVGTLSGGSSSCSAPSSPDFYGRLDASWTFKNATNGQLKAHLDPDNTGCLQLRSKEPGPASPLNTTCTPTLVPEQPEPQVVVPTVPVPTPAPVPTVPVPPPAGPSSPGQVVTPPAQPQANTAGGSFGLGLLSLLMTALFGRAVWRESIGK